MKKIITISALLTAALSMSAQGNQKIIYEDNYGYDFRIRGTHPDFSSGGKVQLFGYSYNYSDEETQATFTFFDDNFDQQREWTFTSPKADSYTQEFVAEVTGYNVEKEYESVDKVYDAATDDYGFYDYENGQWVEGSGPLSVENARRYILERYESTILNEVTTSEGTFFYISYLFGDGGSITRSRSLAKADLQSTDYPTDWFWLTTDGSLNRVRCSYQVEAVVSDNYVGGEKQYQKIAIPFLRLYFTDYDAPYEMEADFRITQTLFNDDAKFEYIRPLVTDGLSYISTSYHSVWNSDLGVSVSVPSISKTFGNRWSGFQVMSEDGSVLQTVNFDGNFVMGNDDEADLVRINGKLYLSFEGNVIDEPNNTRRYATLIYELDRQSSQIRKVMEHVGDIAVTPRVADRSEQITVELNDEGGIREIQVVNGSGQTEVRVPVAKGQKRVSIPASQLSRGMNMVKSVGGRNRQAQKVIVK